MVERLSFSYSADLLNVVSKILRQSRLPFSEHTHTPSQINRSAEKNAIPKSIVDSYKCIEKESSENIVCARKFVKQRF